MWPTALCIVKITDKSWHKILWIWHAELFSSVNTWTSWDHLPPTINKVISLYHNKLNGNLNHRSTPIIHYIIYIHECAPGKIRLDMTCSSGVNNMSYCWGSMETGSVDGITTCSQDKVTCRHWCGHTWASTNSYTTLHYSYTTKGAMASQITSIWIVCSVVCLFRRTSKEISKLASLTLVKRIHQLPVDPPPLPTKDQWRGDDFYLMTSSYHQRTALLWYVAGWSCLCCLGLLPCHGSIMQLRLEQPRIIRVNASQYSTKINNHNIAEQSVCIYYWMKCTSVPLTIVILTCIKQHDNIRAKKKEI